MNELRNNFAHWRRRFIKVNLIMALLVSVVEIIMSVVMYYQHLIFQETLLDYIREYLLQPNVIIWGGMLILALIFKIVNENREFLESKTGPGYECVTLYDSILNASLVLMMTLTCGTVAYVHYIFRVTVACFCIPIFLSIVFYSRRICAYTVVISELMILVVAGHRYVRQWQNDPYILEDLSVIVVILLTVGIIAMNLIKHMREQYEQIVEAREAAEVANQAKSAFLANMSHEIRTPINAVMGMDEMILRRSSDAEITSYAMDIRSASHSLLGIINDILDVSRIEAGKMEILPVQYELSGLIHDVYASLAIRAQDKGLELRLDVDETLPNVLIGDDIRLRQIIINLLSNGVKYTFKGSVTLRVRGEKNGDELNLSVRVTDTGIGIREEDIPKLTQKFQRVDERNNRQIEGAGLGMNIVESLLELMGGSLNIRSTYGVGSTFSFTVKQKIVSDDPIGNLGQRFSEIFQAQYYNKTEDWIAPKAKVLVVDDNAMNLKVFHEMLKHTMMRIDVADSGSACLEKASQVQYDIIFLDDMMPGMNGRQTLKRLRSMKESQCKYTPVVALTANAGKGAMEKYLEEGFDEYLSKPVPFEKMQKTVLSLLPPEVVEYDTGEEELPQAGPEDNAKTLERPDAVDAYEEVNESGTQSAGIPEAAGSSEATEAHAPAAGNTGTAVYNKEDFPEIDGIDWKYGMSVWCNAELLKELAMDFYHELPQNLANLAQWEADADNEASLETFCIKVHALKGSAATIGALNLSAMARLLEKAAKAKDVKQVHLLWPYLKEMMEEYEENMSQWGRS